MVNLSFAWALESLVQTLKSRLKPCVTCFLRPTLFPQLPCARLSQGPRLQPRASPLGHVQWKQHHGAAPAHPHQRLELRALFNFTYIHPVCGHMTWAVALFSILYVFLSLPLILSLSFLFLLSRFFHGETASCRGASDTCGALVWIATVTSEPTWRAEHQSRATHWPCP